MAMQAYFVGFVEVAGVGARRVETAVQIEQVGVVDVGRAEAMDHQLGQGQRLIGRFTHVLPAGERGRTALRASETMEIDVVGVVVADGVFAQ
jgi:hypothetical protein